MRSIPLGMVVIGWAAIGPDGAGGLAMWASGVGTLVYDLADALARTVIEPRELPVGVLTALIGVPMMLWLLRKP